MGLARSAWSGLGDEAATSLTHHHMRPKKPARAAPAFCRCYVDIAAVDRLWDRNTRAKITVQVAKRPHGYEMLGRERIPPTRSLSEKLVGGDRSCVRTPDHFHDDIGKDIFAGSPQPDDQQRHSIQCQGKVVEDAS